MCKKRIEVDGGFLAGIDLENEVGWHDAMRWRGRFPSPHLQSRGQWGQHTIKRLEVIEASSGSHISGLCMEKRLLSKYPLLCIVRYWCD